MRLHPELSRLGKLVLFSYRSFSALYHRLKIFFYDKKKWLPSCSMFKKKPEVDKATLFSRHILKSVYLLVNGKILIRNK